MNLLAVQRNDHVYLFVCMYWYLFLFLSLRQAILYLSRLVHLKCSLSRLSCLCWSQQAQYITV